MIYLVSTFKSYNRVKPGNIKKVKLYMHHGQSIYQNKYVLHCKTTFFAFHAWPILICNLLVMGKTVLLRETSQQTLYDFRFAPKLAKAYQHQLL